MAATKVGYPKAALYRRGPQITYSGANLSEIAFPLGGIGTGMITLGGWGQLRDWEIFNRPAKGKFVANSFFAIRARRGKSDVTRVLQGPVEGDFVESGSGMRRLTGEGLPHFRKCTFRGEYPFAWVELSDRTMPVRVTLEAFNPFIPLNDQDSSVPVAIFTYTVKNVTKRPVDVTLFGTLGNPVGVADAKEGRVNEARREPAISGLYLSNAEVPPDSPKFGSMALAALGGEVSIAPAWPIEDTDHIWDGIAVSPHFPPEKAAVGGTGTVAAAARIPAGKSVAVTFLVAWHFPNFEHWEKPTCDSPGCDCRPATWKNWYATVWRDAWDVAAYVVAHLERLTYETRLFHDALFSSTLPAHVLDAVSANVSILKTPTCLRLTDGTFYGFEGTGDTEGCCQGSCTHVWNYEQALAYLFPALKRSQREAEYRYSQREDGFEQFRIPLPLGTKPTFAYHPAADGQMGGVMQVYREWLISGDTDWLKGIWPAAKKSLEFAWQFWDADRDGVMEGVQHNTYDIEFYGPNTLCGSLYLGALLAAERMAKIVGDAAAAAAYRQLFEKGSKWADSNLFNGEYYEQKVLPDAAKNLPEPYRKLTTDHGLDDKFPWPKWQYGKGCLSDQMIGQWYASMLGLGNLYDAKKVRRALQSIFRYNWRRDLTDHACSLRLYAMRDEAGLIVCTWPKGGRPGFPLAYYADEVWCGIEYQVASHLIYEGLTDEGLAVALGARERHRGARRNPWDEFECGHHYSRSMASYALLLALSGFSYNAAEGRMGFAPRVCANDFRAFWSVGSGWGVYAQKAAARRWTFSVEAKYGSLALKELDVKPGAALPKTVAADLAGDRVRARVVKTASGAAIVFDDPVWIDAGQKLSVTLA